ncbi:MAG: hypothetical protein ABI696_11770 [Rubrivivax sp.]
MTSTVLSASRLAGEPRSPAAARPSLQQRLWAALVIHGERRAAAEMRHLALTRFAHAPAVRQQLLDAANATTRRA